MTDKDELGVISYDKWLSLPHQTSEYRDDASAVRAVIGNGGHCAHAVADVQVAEGAWQFMDSRKLMPSDAAPASFQPMYMIVRC
jgi:hypothetical protein